MGYTPSKRQSAICKEWKDGNKNIVIEAVAGSGKTTVLLELLKLCDAPTLFIAFNKSIQEEIQGYIESQGLVYGESMTIHSLGFSALREHYKNVTLDNRKYFTYPKVLEQSNGDIYSNLKKGEKFKLSVMLSNMNNLSRTYLTNDFLEVMQYMAIHSCPILAQDIINLKDLERLFTQYIIMREESYEGDDIVIDFTDMIYLPVEKELHLPVTHKYLMVDEAQDLSAIHHMIINKIISQGKCERWVAVGDRNQSIYGFSGSLSNSFDSFLAKDNVVELPLDICYRCPPNIVAEANKVYDVMVPFKTEDGIVEYITEVSKVKNNSMVICRNSEPLLHMYFELISNGKKAYIKGNDILDRIMNFLKDNKFDTVFKLFQKTTKKIASLSDLNDSFHVIQKRRLKESMKMMQILVDKGFVRMTDKCSVAMVRFENLFKVESGGITLCTIHKAKGLESEVVYILNEFLIPSEYAESDEDYLQEDNLKYVARTRASKEMYYLTIEFEGDKKKKEKKNKTLKLDL